MKQPTITYEGQEYNVSAISWIDDGLSHACFTDKNGVFHTAFNKMPNEKEGYNKRVLNLDLNKCMK